MEAKQIVIKTKTTNARAKQNPGVKTKKSRDNTAQTDLALQV